MVSYNNFYGNIVDCMFSGRMITQLYVGIAMSGTGVNTKGNTEQCFVITKKSIAHCAHYINTVQR